jgi:putative lipoprotein (rSAM/lipoprotein system)
MKKIKNSIVPALITILGYSLTACIEEYGIPTTTFHFKGKVIDEQSNPLKNIQITSKQDKYRVDTLYTTSTGTFENTYKIVDPNNQFIITANDIDGEENGGHFSSETKFITLDEDDFQKKRNDVWYEGTAQKEVSFKLKMK